VKSKGFFLAAIFAAVLCFSGHVLAALSGSGTEANPYLIQSQADFDEFANPANAALYWASGIYTKLMYDPNLASMTCTQAVIAPDTSTSSGFQGAKFLGDFNGNGHVISNLTINQPTKDYIGLFGYVGSGGQVKNLGVKNVNLTGRNPVGGLAGYNYYGSITSCYATGVVSGTSDVGGLVGRRFFGSITSCYATVAVSGTSYVGGLVGNNYNGSMTSCYATGAVTGTGDYVGGLIGVIYGTITSCYATGAVTGTGDYVGGLIGVIYGTITSCYATGTVSGISYVGGLVGVIYGSLVSCYATGSVSGTDYFVGGLVGYSDEFSTIISCYATGSVNGTFHVGGLVGINDYGSITSCYATGTVNGYNDVGGLVGYTYYGSITSCFWNIQTSGTSNGVGNMNPDPNGVTGKTMAQMMMLSTFTSAGWDFSDTDGDAADWMMLRENEDYPRLAWQAIHPGDIAGLYGVNMTDLMEVVNNWLEQGCPASCQQADIDNSGTVDLADLSILAANWMTGA
jgi:hypothetical protein